MSNLTPFVHQSKTDGVEYLDFNEVFTKGGDEAKADASALLEKLHAGIYCKTFPLANEQEAVEDWLERLHKGEEQKPQQFFTMYGKGIDTANPETVGFIVSEYYNGTGCGLYNYVLRDEKYKSKGEHPFPAKEMCDHHMELMESECLKADGHNLKGALWEANDPKKIQWDEKNPDFEVDCMSPAKRVEHIEKKFGAKKLGFDYVQTPLTPCKSNAQAQQDTCEDLLFYQYGAKDHPDLKPQDVKKFLTTFAQNFSEVEHPTDLKVPSVNKMMGQLHEMEAHNIPMLEEKQTHIQKTLLNKIPDKEYKEHKHKEGLTQAMRRYSLEEKRDGFAR